MRRHRSLLRCLQDSVCAVAPFPQGFHANSLEATESPLPALEDAVLLTRQSSMALPVHLPTPPVCCGELLAATRNGTKRFLPWLRFAACNLHCMRGAPLHLCPYAGSSSGQVLLLLISPSKCSLLLHSVLEVSLIYRRFTPSPAAQATRWGEQKLFIHVCQEINFAKASKCMLGEWCKQGVVMCGLL